MNVGTLVDKENRSLSKWSFRCLCLVTYLLQLCHYQVNNGLCTYLPRSSFWDSHTPKFSIFNFVLSLYLILNWCDFNQILEFDRSRSTVFWKYFSPLYSVWFELLSVWFQHESGLHRIFWPWQRRYINNQINRMQSRCVGILYKNHRCLGR